MSVYAATTYSIQRDTTDGFPPDSEMPEGNLREPDFDALTKFLGESLVYEKYSFPFLMRETSEGRVRLLVGQYYPRIKLAVDKITDIRKLPEFFVELKKELLNKNGIRYVYLTRNKKTLAEIAAEIKAQKI